MNLHECSLPGVNYVARGCFNLVTHRAGQHTSQTPASLLTGYACFTCDGGRADQGGVPNRSVSQKLEKFEKIFLKKMAEWGGVVVHQPIFVKRLIRSTAVTEESITACYRGEFIQKI